MMPTILITGGTRGLGRALVVAFARRGYRVYTTARGVEGLAALADHAAAEPLDVVTLRADVSRVEDNAAVASRIVADGHKLDVVIHNAGLLGPRVPLASYPSGEFSDVMAANVFAPFDLTRQLLPMLAPNCALIFVSSGVSLGPREGWGAYNVSKIALDGLAGIWARELRGDGVRVFIVDPGGMRTDMRAAAYPSEDPMTLPTPEENAEAYIRLAEEGLMSETGRRYDVTEWSRLSPG